MVVFLLLTNSAFALTMRERWRADDLKWREISNSICENCVQLQRVTRRALFVDPIAVLELKISSNKKFSGKTNTGIVATKTADEILVARHRQRMFRYAQLLKRQRNANLIRTRRYKFVAHRHKLKKTPRAAAIRNEIELGKLKSNID